MARFSGRVRARSTETKELIPMSRRRNRLMHIGTFITLMAMLSVIAHAQSPDVPGPPVYSVIAEGRAAGTDLLAKDEALQDAKRKAVAQACGEFIDAGTKVEDYEVVRDRILSQALGYITRYNVKREWEEDGISHCEIVAYIQMQQLEHDWRAAFSQLREDQDNPRTMIIFTEDPDATDLIPPKTGGATQKRFQSVFLTYGADLIDSDISEEVRRRDISLAELTDNISKLAAMASSFKADMLVLGEATAVPLGSTDLGGTNVYRFEVSLNVTVVQADSARILASDSYGLGSLHLESGPNCTDKAFRKLADENVEKVLRDVFDAWRQRASSQRIIQIVFENCSYRTFSKTIKPALSRMRGVQQGAEGVKSREFVNDTGTVDIYWAFDIDLLADKLLDLEVEGLTFDVTEKTGDRLHVRVNGGP
jgi:hypothetical protein